MEPIAGVVVGIVSSVEDPEGEGRVELRFPWLPGEIRSAWAPVAAPLAGANRGYFLSPEVDDEVLVAFEHGDFDHPFVVGYLWNGVDRPPETDRHNRVLVTPGGHTLRFEDDDKDKPGKRVILKSNAGHEIVLDDEGKNLIVRFNGGGSIKMTQNDLVLQHGHSITLTPQGIALS